MKDIIDAWKIISPFVSVTGEDLINGRPIEGVKNDIRLRLEFLVGALLSEKLSKDDQKSITMLYGCTIRLLDSLDNVENATIIDPKTLKIS